MEKNVLQSTRRRFMQVGTGTVLASTLFAGSTAADGGSGSSNYTDQVDAGLSYFITRADEQLPLVESLLSAIESGDLDKAKSAYVAARPPYEEIEVLAASFEETDSDIDARPTSFEMGETSEKFKGFHRIERLLYRDERIEDAVPYAEELVTDVKNLQSALRERKQFDAIKHFQGMTGLAQEVPTKKITSEEETFSGQSLLIFWHNWKGIYSQFEPFIPVLEERDPAVAREVTDAYHAARAIVDPLYSGCNGGTHYREVGNDTRGEIVSASYRYRDALLEAQKTLKLSQ